MGGYLTAYKLISGYELAVVAYTTINASDAGFTFTGRKGTEIKYDADGNYVSSKSSLCGLGITDCYMFKNTQTPYWQNQKRLQEYMQVVGDPVLYSLAYTVKKNIAYSRNGRFLYFNYGVAIYDNTKGHTYNITSSALLNNNTIVKELSKAHKGEMEYMLRYGKIPSNTKWLP
ncbi:hypothetical protein [Campylobacter troglodytis]|uniref:hypothetical protein n=1 Tax=Campylobacter troglodytis TaxID=654363 RepID=UPI00115A4911|nr:hypothetical protein [Campylobacter troglodytis]TQR53015.1 hypothetical protein DMC01_12345 [Campylobacter troglodytis]